MKTIAWIVALLATAGLACAEEAKPQESQGGPRRGIMNFEEMDANKDGKVALEEFQTGQDKRIDERFGRMDKNSDGTISKDEMPPAPAADSPRARFMPDFSKLDKDGSGTVTKQEFADASKEGAKEGFARLDKNSDGAVTKDEMDSAREQFRGRRAAGGAGAPAGEKKDEK